jgi:lysophospholipase L1-like esterase
MRRLIVCLGVVVALVGLAVTPARATGLRGGYVALGDSYTAGPVIPLQDTQTPGCLRSDHNYPSLIAPALSATYFRDASCSGATTQDMTQPQDVTPPPANAPQFDRLARDSKLVTLGIGGNDIGFVEIIENCGTPLPVGTPCQDHYVVNGDDTLQDRIDATAPKVAAVLQGIHARSPQAKVYVVGYPSILPETGPGCWPQMPLAPDDMPYLRHVEHALNAMLASTATANGAHYVDTFTPSLGHDACQLVTVRWIEPLAPNLPAAPVHPNARGEQGMATAVLAAISRR